MGTPTPRNITKKAEQQPAEHDADAVKRILLRMAKPLHQRTPGADIKQAKGKKIAPHRPQKDCGPHHKVGEGAEGSQSHRQRKDGEHAVDQNGNQNMQRVAAAEPRHAGVCCSNSASFSSKYSGRSCLESRASSKSSVVRFMESILNNLSCF